MKVVGLSMEDLRQMYVYADLFAAEKVALFYPGEGKTTGGNYHNGKECALLSVVLPESGKTGNIKAWQTAISKQVGTFIDFS